MTDILKGIDQIIRDNLPGQTADQLKKALDEFAQLKRDHETLKGDLRIAKDHKEQLSNEKAQVEHEFKKYKEEHKDLEGLRERLERKSEELRVRESGIRLEVTTHQLAVAHEHRQLMENFMLNLSRNQVFKKTILDEKSYVVPPTPGMVDTNGYVHSYPGRGHVETHIDKKTETIEEE